jgi:hypothetical protein
MTLRLLKPAWNEGTSGMRSLVILAACGLLCGCEAQSERLQDRYDSLFKTKAQLEAEDTAACQRLGAMPGTDIYVQCMIGRAQIRATNNASNTAGFYREEAAGRAINPGAYR